MKAERKDEFSKTRRQQMESDLRTRTKRFALEVIQLYSDLPSKTVARVLGDQMLRSGTSVGAHYREAQRAKSNADFISKIEGGLQELEETQYWLELLAESGMMSVQRLSLLSNESNELIPILVSIVKRTKSRERKR
jgi:four helix bundle protein